MSKTFAQVDFIKDTKTLVLVFNWDTDFQHEYKVPVKVGQGMLKAESKGKFFHANIRPKYTAEKVARVY
jgi:hypothetical protein